MMRAALPRAHFAPSTPACSCTRHASQLPASLTAASAPPPPPPVASLYAQPGTAALSSALDNPAWSDPAYLRRYRDPASHDALVPTTPAQRRSYETAARAAPAAATSATGGSTSTASTSAEASENGNGGKRQRSRRNRLEMEALWSGGDFSPPIPLESYRAQTTRPRHALLFPGSGSQYVGMGHFLRKEQATQDVWAEAEEALESFEEWRKGLRLHEKDGELGQLGKMLDETEASRRKKPKLHEVVFEGPQDQLTRSFNAQPAILITSVAFLRTLEKHYDLPLSKTASLILGHSSGEYSAAVATGALSLTDGVRLTRLHGLLTHYALSLPSIGLSPKVDAPPAQRGQMSALVLNPGHSHAELTEVIRKIRSSRSNQKGAEGTVEVASFNSSTQVVLAGSRDGILRASEVLRELEIANRAADLPVSAPFHCSFMAPAAAGMHAALTSPSIKLSTPSSPLVSGLDASLITSPSSLVSNLVSQISLPVRWSTCLASLPAQHDVRRLIFLGPGQALANLARRDAKLVKEAEVAAGKDAAEAERRETEVLSVATEKDMDTLRDMWTDEDGA
ncbi:hypothetical protein Rhopal_004750-T1 [Rhodotorula paludigena]|uniref:[acyl-carrier-protein] S-malonyltransferase n=1 Tax=Rhodotorula paludigena TaxID=86838 RepID=A0AAV5GQG4_9BASI|nr:hypothetical protein Rhopal_004750-T1 [Rhodotorula paludigena]